MAGFLGADVGAGHGDAGNVCSTRHCGRNHGLRLWYDRVSMANISRSPTIRIVLDRFRCQLICLKRRTVQHMTSFDRRTGFRIRQTDFGANRRTAYVIAEWYKERHTAQVPGRHH